MSDTTDPVDLMDLSTFVADREMPVFDRLRSEAPVHWNPASANGPAFWSLTSYADVRDGATDAARLSSASGTQIVDRKVEGHGRSSLHNMDDPEHAKLRKIAIPYLRAVKIKEWQRVIEDSVAHLLDEARAHGDFDMVALVSARLPMLVLSRVLGVPAEDAPKMVDWTNRMTSSDPDHKVDAASLAKARDELLGYFEKLTTERRARPTDDLISILANGQKDGEPLTWEELAAYYIVLVAAGNETTRHLVSGATLAFHQHPPEWDRLVQQPDMLATAVEEMFRYVTPVAAMRRTALADLKIRDVQIQAGQRVVLWFSAANRDPEMFPEPHAFKIDRTPNEHMTFGWGVHFCLGAHLARAEVKAFWAETLRRKYRFEVTGASHRVRHNLFRGWSELR